MQLLNIDLFLVLCITKLSLSETERSIVMELDPREIAETFKTVISSKYIKEIANEIANKATQNFIHRMKSKKRQLGRNEKSIGQGKLEEQRLPPVMKGSASKHLIKDDGELNYLKPRKRPQISNPLQNFRPQQQLPQNGPYSDQEQRFNDNEHMEDIQQSDGPSLQAPKKRPQLETKDDAYYLHNKNELDENLAFALLKDPSPDGDDWQMDSLELSEIRSNIPVVEVKKINGKHFRRLLDRLFFE